MIKCSLPAPAEIHWLTNIIGASAALAMIEAHGGTRVYVPKDINQNSAARLALPLPEARRLGEAFGGEHILVPIARAWRVRMYRAAGLTYPAIARKLGITERAVGRILTDAGLTTSQGDLFGNQAGD
ncbi:MAG: hypothetical protein INF79_15460 [Roseomonas sp.]|nr:hypothetical protein [Roseomonas sp.]